MKIILCIRWRLGKVVLEKIYNQYEIVCVISDTKEIIDFCIEKNIPINSNDANWCEALKIPHDLIISCMFNRIIDKISLQQPQLGGINIHQSLLPLYRGKSPVLAAINDNQKQIGFTIHYMNERIDRGNILVQLSWGLDYDISLEKLMDQYIETVPTAVVFAIYLVLNGNSGVKQDDKIATYCKSYNIDIDWNQSLHELKQKLEDLT